ncbi:hypothetical protein [Pantoea vagans]|uniref:hypothetical protein n=1 Tax=Pantoea vagans TaxID=470934 RepID=UPI00117C7E1C|nr:hypothetical protein [Pantoea vagans]
MAIDKMTIALISALTWIVSFLVYRHNANKDKSSLVLELNKEISSDRNSKLVIEYLFSVIYGVKGTDFSDIELLVKHPLPQKAIINFLSVQRYIQALKLSDDSGEIRVVVAEAWRKGWKRRLNQVGFLIVIPVMCWFAKIFSDLSYGYFLSIYDSTFPLLIKNGGVMGFLMEVIVNIAIPIMFSTVGYLAFRSFYSSTMIDVTAKFLDSTYTPDNNN